MGEGKKTLKKNRSPVNRKRRADGQRIRGPGKWTVTIKRLFLEALGQGYSISGAAELADIGRTTIYNQLREKKDFSDEVDKAIEVGTDRLVDEARRRALIGIDEQVIWKGAASVIEDGKGNKRALTVKRYSDVLLMFLLNARRPNKYKQRHELTGKDGGPIEIKTFADVARASVIPLGKPANDQGKRPVKQRKRA